MTAQPVVYRVYDDDDRLIYIGSTVQPLQQRMGVHRYQSWWIGLVARVDVEPQATLLEAREAEKAAIRTESPAFNQQHAGHWWASPMHLTERETAVCREWLASHRSRIAFLPLRLRWVAA